ncbi:serine hydrolase domain-containing protein [Aminipila sp.]|uniref:serine hydrolase domain-containing protein n=1 Tax=Aminipila sp. TaxID=2060095 RepID=UPI00289E1B7D|nr:serine hydrolase domain-containing protein [Aminipila sp.]
MITKKLDEYLKDALFYHDLAGLAIGVTVGLNSPLKCRGLNYKKAAGYKNFITKENLQADNIFHVASVTKLFVGTSIMILYERGLLELDSPIVKIIPWLLIDDKRYKDITIRHLLTHTAGLTDVSDYGWDKPEFDEAALRRYVQSDEVVKSKLLWSPLERNFKYSNIGYEILGTIIAEIAGVSFEEFVSENILKPLQMDNTALLTFERASGSLNLQDLEKVNMAMPHTKDQEKHIILEKQYPYNRAHGPSSTITTNLTDLEKWARANIEKRILKEESYAEIWKPQAEVPNNGENVGVSWFIREQNGYTLYGHEGNDDGFRASFWICPELDLHIAVESNISKAPVKGISKKILNIMTSA